MFTLSQKEQRNCDLELVAIPKLTSRQYRDLTRHMRMSDQSHARAYAVLVEGRPIQEVADEAGVSAESVRKICRRIVGDLRSPLPQLDAADFESAVHGLRISDENVARARRVLVDGESLLAVAEDTGVSAGVLSRVVWKILDAAIPPGWRRVSVTVPEEMAQKIEDMERQAKEKYWSGR